jgi:hypothetical protein
MSPVPSSPWSPGCWRRLHHVTAMAVALAVLPACGGPYRAPTDPGVANLVATPNPVLAGDVAHLRFEVLGEPYDDVQAELRESPSVGGCLGGARPAVTCTVWSQLLGVAGSNGAAEVWYSAPRATRATITITVSDPVSGRIAARQVLVDVRSR